MSTTRTHRQIEGLIAELAAVRAALDAAEARLAEVEAERDGLREAMIHLQVIADQRETDRALADAERDDVQSLYRQAREMHEVYRARLAAVEALCDQFTLVSPYAGEDFKNRVRAAARGEDHNAGA